MLEMEFNCLRM